MSNVSTLKMSITQEVGWFVLENENMDQRIFSDLVNQLKEIISSLYKGKNAKKNDKEEIYVKKEIDENGQVILKVAQEKVPNIIKLLVQHPTHDIQINLTGIKPQREVVSRMITKPFDPKSVTELVPCYHGKEVTQEQNNQLKNKR